MSDLQPSYLLPSSEDVSHAQVMRLSADDRIVVGQSSADEQNDAGSSADERSNEEFSADEWSVEELYSGEQIATGCWKDARFQGTLSLALSARIPLEVFEIIIDVMDPPKLTVAALVCAAWYPRAMHKLYHTIEIRSRTSYNLLFKQCYASPRLKQWLASTCELVANEQWDAFFEILKDKRDSNEDGSMESPQRRNKNNSDNHFLQALPSALASLMPCVHNLHIYRARLCFVHTDFFLALSRFESVKSLTLRNCGLNNITQLRRIVSAFPQLTDLTLYVYFAQQGAASYAGASLSQPPPHMRLRYLDVNLNDERMAMFSDWMMHSGLCTSLADLTVSPEVASMAQIPLNKLLETAGTSLISFRLSNGFNYGRSVHGSVLQNTALRSWSFELQLIERVAKDQGPRAVWTKAMNELHGIFSTVRSRHLEYIKVKVRVPVGDSILEPEQLGVVLEGLDLRGLHEVVSQPYFDALQDVEVKIVLAPLTRHWQTRLHVDGIDLDSIGQQLQTMFHGILQPWVARGIVAITWL